MGLLNNLIFLCDDMRDKNWVMQIITFIYKSKKYYVVIKLYQSGEKKPKNALCEIKFLDSSNLHRSLTMPATINGLLIPAKELRKYFNIEYRENVGELLRQFTAYFGRFIPLKASAPDCDTEKRILVGQLSRSDSEDPNKVYCIGVKRNPVRNDGMPGKRSNYNDNKARLLRPLLYSILKDEQNFSFCFSADKDRERTDSEILTDLQRR